MVIIVKRSKIFNFGNINSNYSLNFMNYTLIIYWDFELKDKRNTISTGIIRAKCKVALAPTSFTALLTLRKKNFIKSFAIKF